MLEHSPETTGLLDTTLPFHWLTFFQAVASHPLSANLEETFLTHLTKDRLLPPKHKRRWKAKLLLVIWSPWVSTCLHAIFLGTTPETPAAPSPWGRCAGWWQEHLPRLHTSGSFCFCWFVFDICFPLRSICVGKVHVHLTQKPKRKYSLLGAATEDVSGGGKGWDSSQAEWMRPWMSFSGHCYCCFISSVLSILNIVFT